MRAGSSVSRLFLCKRHRFQYARVSFLGRTGKVGAEFPTNAEELARVGRVKCCGKRYKAWKSVEGFDRASLAALLCAEVFAMSTG